MYRIESNPSFLLSAVTISPERELKIHHQSRNEKVASKGKKEKKMLS